MVEHELREDIRVYETQNLTPSQLGTRILQHPAMLVTSRLKQRFASSITVEQNYAGQVVQTVKFPFRRLDDVAVLLERNLQATRTFLRKLGAAVWKESGPVWQGVDPEAVLEFLQSYQVDAEARSVSLPLLCDYIERQRELRELARWTVAVKGRESRDATLGEADWGVAGGRIFQVSRTRLASDLNNIGVLTSPGDEEEGLSAEARAQARALAQAENVGVNPAARRVRAKEEGLLLLYPISRFSGAQDWKRAARAGRCLKIRKARRRGM